MKNKNKEVYYALIILSLVLFAAAFTILNNTKIIAPVVIVIGIYLFLGAVIKLCKMNDRLKNTLICALDILFWLP